MIPDRVQVCFVACFVEAYYVLNNCFLQIFKCNIKIPLPILVPTKTRFLARGGEHPAGSSGLISTLDRRKAEKFGLPMEVMEMFKHQVDVAPSASV